MVMLASVVRVYGKVLFSKVMVGRKWRRFGNRETSFAHPWVCPLAFFFRLFLGSSGSTFEAFFSSALWSHGRLTILPNGSFLLLPLAVVSTSQGCLLVLVVGSCLTLLRRQHTPRTLPLLLLGKMEKCSSPVRRTCFAKKPVEDDTYHSY